MLQYELQQFLIGFFTSSSQRYLYLDIEKVFQSTICNIFK